LIFAAIFLTPLTAAAVDIGNIAIIEDIGGAISKWAANPMAYQKNAACAFYNDHDDIYDAIIIFSGVVLDGISNIQQGGPIWQVAKGIGREPATDMRTLYCSTKNKRLKNIVKMGTLSGAAYALPDNPDDRAVIVPGYSLTGIELVAHEFGHYWLASIDYKQDSTKHCWIRGWECSGSGDQCKEGDLCDGVQESSFNNHWSYYMNSRSVMYGSFIEDLGGGRYKFTYPFAGFSQLDQYLMGLRTPAEVTQELFLVKDGAWDLTSGSSSIPMQHNAEKTVTGVRFDFDMNDVIAANGPRDPEKEPCHWKTAFVLIYPEGKTIEQIQPLINKLNVYRNRWEEYYDWATDHRGSMDTTLNGHGPGTPTCPAPGYPDGGYPEDDAGKIDGGTPSDGGIGDGGIKDAGTKDGGTSDGGTKDGGQKDGSLADSGTKPDGSASPDAGEMDDGGATDDAGEPETDGSHHGGDGDTPVDPTAGCSCSKLGL
jgi:hypothetical protein